MSISFREFVIALLSFFIIFHRCFIVSHHFSMFFIIFHRFSSLFNVFRVSHSCTTSSSWIILFLWLLLVYFEYAAEDFFSFFKAASSAEMRQRQKLGYRLSCRLFGSGNKIFLKFDKNHIWKGCNLTMIKVSEVTHKTQIRKQVVKFCWEKKHLCLP